MALLSLSHDSSYITGSFWQFPRNHEDICEPKVFTLKFWIDEKCIKSIFVPSGSGVAAVTSVQEQYTLLQIHF
jgi:hypothetical protein